MYTQCRGALHPCAEILEATYHLFITGIASIPKGGHVRHTLLVQQPQGIPSRNIYMVIVKHTWVYICLA
jgi:hypothetical protein